LAWAAAHHPRQLVLDLGVSDQFTEQLITVIAVARQQLPVGCLLEICSARPAVRNMLELAGWTGVQVSAALQEAGPPRPGGYGRAGCAKPYLTAGTKIPRAGAHWNLSQGGVRYLVKFGLAWRDDPLVAADAIGKARSQPLAADG